MGLTTGSCLGPYEILSALGAGGEVYRARDTRLDRTVAIKVLPDNFAQDPERVARFQREAKTLASLNHANIGGIHGLEESGGVTALVLELVEGPTLADRIAQVDWGVGRRNVITDRLWRGRFWPEFARGRSGRHAIRRVR
jgi:serine/threonine protein kinase